MHLREYESQLLNIPRPYVLSSCQLRHIHKFVLTTACTAIRPVIVRRLKGTRSGSRIAQLNIRLYVLVCLV